MATSTATGRNEALRQLGAAFAVCLLGSLGLIAYGWSIGPLEFSLVAGWLFALGLEAGLVAPSLAGLGAALAGGWAGLLGYALAYSIVHADMAEAGFYNSLGIMLAAVGVPLTVAPGFLLGALVARWSRAGGRRRSRVPIVVGFLVLLGAVGALAVDAMRLFDGGGSITVTLGSETVTYRHASCGVLVDGWLDVDAGEEAGATVHLSIPTDGGVAELGGTIGGAQWHVTDNARASLNADGTGTFSGRDAERDVNISGVFTCPAEALEPEHD